jgi:hypothetical protein
MCSIAKFSKILSVIILCCLFVFVTSSVFAAWTYQPADLGGANCVQDKLDQMGAQGGTNILNAVQKGSVTSPMVSYTNTFAQTFLETPVVFYRYTVAGYAATSSVTVVSNQFVIVASTNFSWMAVGRVK